MKPHRVILALAAATLVFATACVAPAAEDEVKTAKKGYELKFGDAFEPGMNHVDDIGISIVIMMDASGSMADPPSSGGAAKYVQAAEALKKVGDYLSGLATSQPGITINVAILAFESEVREILPLTKLDEKGIQRLTRACVSKNFSPGGNTAIGLALERGSGILAQSGTILNSLILVTDGENTAGVAPEKVIAAIYEDRNNKTTEDLPVRTSTQLMSMIGFDVDSPQFVRFGQLGARITAAGDQTELEKTLRDLLEADITKLESK
jgi:hypothetical protein